MTDDKKYALLLDQEKWLDKQIKVCRADLKMVRNLKHSTAISALHVQLRAYYAEMIKVKQALIDYQPMEKLSDTDLLNLIKELFKYLALETQEELLRTLESYVSVEDEEEQKEPNAIQSN